MAGTGTASGLDRIATAFSSHGRRAALMPYMMGGFPDSDGARRVLCAYADAGADLVELGFPFSDPLADGPVIQAAGQRALEAGATTESVLELASELAGRVPLVAMAYSNPVRAFGLDQFAEGLAAAGVAGLIVPDLPLEEADEARQACDARGLALVGLVAPTTPEPRVAAITSLARGFIYVVSVTGVTGARQSLPPELADVVARVRAHTDLPAAVGFGVGSPETASAVADLSDGVIIGSALVGLVAEAPDAAAGAQAAKAFLARVVTALE